MLSAVELSDHLLLRHNGVIIEAIETAIEGEENRSSRSRSGTPSSKNNDNPKGVPVQAHQGVPTATGPSSYYRQHTALTNRKSAFSLLRPHFSYAPIQRTYHHEFRTKCKITNLSIRHPQTGRHLLGQAILTGRVVYHHRI